MSFKVSDTPRANCTPTIAFFTDGVEGDTVAEDVFDKYNKDKRVSIIDVLSLNWPVAIFILQCFKIISCMCPVTIDFVYSQVKYNQILRLYKSSLLSAM